MAKHSFLSKYNDFLNPLVQALPNQIAVNNGPDRFSTIFIHYASSDTRRFFIVRAFVLLRELALMNETIARKVEQMGRRVSDHDEILIELIQEIKKLIASPKSRQKQRAIGFVVPKNTVQ